MVTRNMQNCYIKPVLNFCPPQCSYVALFSPLADLDSITIVVVHPCSCLYWTSVFTLVVSLHVLFFLQLDILYVLYISPPSSSSCSESWCSLYVMRISMRCFDSWSIENRIGLPSAFFACWKWTFLWWCCCLNHSFLK